MDWILHHTCRPIIFTCSLSLSFSIYDAHFSGKVLHTFIHNTNYRAYINHIKLSQILTHMLVLMFMLGLRCFIGCLCVVFQLFLVKQKKTCKRCFPFVHIQIYLKSLYAMTYIRNVQLDARYCER